MIKNCNSILKRLTKEQGFIIEPTIFQLDFCVKMFMNDIRADIKNLPQDDLAYQIKLNDELALANKWYGDRIRHRTNKNTFKNYLNVRHLTLTK